MNIEITIKIELGLEIWIVSAGGIELRRYMASWSAERYAANLIARYPDAKLTRNDAPRITIKAA